MSGARPASRATKSESGPAGAPAPPLALAECARAVRAGELVVHPAESVYGFGGALDPRPLEALRALKGRASSGFVVLVPRVDEVEELLGAAGRALADAFWPGPLTLVVDDPAGRFPSGAKAADGSVAVRVPGRAETLALLGEAGRPMTSTSANAPGGRPAVTAEGALAAARALGREMAVLDAGPLCGGPASTLVRLGAPRPAVLREGRVSARDVARALGEPSPAPRDVAASPRGDALRPDTGAARRPSAGPEPGAEPFVVTFVCTGNTCRSPMAEAIARRAFDRRGMSGFHARSAGVAAWPGAPASDGALRAAAESGLDLEAHRSEPLSRETAESSSLLLCMGRSHLARTEALGGGGRCRLLKEMAGGGGEVADPFGRSDRAYRETFAELEAAVEAVVEGLAGRA